MDPAEDTAGAADLSAGMPERWETAIEDLAQVVALGLDRAQDLADVVTDVVRARPVLAKALLAAAVGAAVGVFMAERSSRRPKVSSIQRRGSAADARSRSRPSIVEEAAAIARDAAELLARRPASRARTSESRSRVNGFGWEATLRQLRDVAQLAPVAATLIRNPLVRLLLLRTVVRAARRR